jgi:1,2-diacylglycerol 3-alpha-glucosyltransferase
MEHLNIAFYTDSYLPAMDGVVTSILNSKAELERRGHNVYIFASSYPRNIKKYSSKKVFLYPGREFKPYPQYNVALFPYNSAFKLNELGIDIVHAHTPMVMGFSALVGAKLFGYPLVSSFHTMVTNKPIMDAYYPRNRHLKKLAATYLMRYLKFFYNSSDSVIAPTRTTASMLGRHGIRNVNVVPNSIDTKIMNPGVDGDRIREKLGIKGREKVVLYLGRLSKEKRLETLLYAARILMKRSGNIRLVIAGTGPYERHYMDLAKRLGIMGNTLFTGFVDKRQLAGMYAAADVFCLPSTFETQGIVLIEAMAVGTPVVGANYLATKEMIKAGENGEKFRPGDYTECARKIEKVLNNTERYKHSAIKTAEEFSKEKVAERLLEIYNLVLSKKGIY